MEQRLKRTDYTKGVRLVGQHAPIERAAPVIARAKPQPLRTGPIPMETQGSEPTHKKKPSFSFRFELPTLRRPPDTGDLTSRGGKWALIVALGAVFFIIGYTV